MGYVAGISGGCVMLHVSLCNGHIGLLNQFSICGIDGVMPAMASPQSEDWSFLRSFLQLPSSLKSAPILKDLSLKF